MKLADVQLLTVSALVRFPKLRDEVLYKARPEYFDDMNHRMVIEALKESKTKLDLIRAVSSLGGVPYLKNLASYAYKQIGNVSLREINQWLNLLAIESKKSESLDILSHIEDELINLDMGASSDPLIANLVEGLIETSTDRISPGFRSLDEVHDEVSDSLLGLRHGKVINRTPTGFKTLDKFLGGGLMNGLVTIGGEPGTGKTTLALEIAYNVARAIESEVKTSPILSDPGIIAIVSAEMSMADLILRMIQMELGISTTDSTKKMSVKNYERAAKFHNYLSGLPFVVDDSDMLSSNTVYSRLESLFLKYKRVRLIIVDFAELILDTDGSDGGSKEQQLGKVYIKASILAKRYNCPVVVISHLSRSLGYNNPTRVPAIEHLRYTRLAEAVSSMVGFIYDPYGYELRGKPIPTPTTMPSIFGTAYILWAKHRNGPTGIKPMGWKPEFTQWSDLPASGIYHQVTSDEALRLDQE